jgi:hypothetical protein
LAPLALIVGLAGCGQSAVTRSPQLSQLPLIKGARIVKLLRQCDSGSDAFCALQVIVTDNHFKSSVSLVRTELKYLKQLRWTAAAGDTPDERAADSPGHKLRLTYGTAFADLKGVDLGWIMRPTTITMTLSNEMFSRDPTMSLELEAGPA